MTRDPLLALSRGERDQLREMCQQALWQVTDAQDVDKLHWMLGRLNEVDRATHRLH